MICKYLVDNQCRLASEFAEVETDVKEDACRACMNCLLPMQQNYVVYSIAIGAIKDPIIRKVKSTEWAKKGYFLLGRKEVNEVVFPPGVGTELHRILGSKGFHITPGCKCVPTIEKMNSGGVEWCRNNIKSIVEIMVEEARARSILAPEALMRVMAKRYIKKAIYNYEKATSENKVTSG